MYRIHEAFIHPKKKITVVQLLPKTAFQDEQTIALTLLLQLKFIKNNSLLFKYPNNALLKNHHPVGEFFAIVHHHIADIIIPRIRCKLSL